MKKKGFKGKIWTEKGFKETSLLIENGKIGIGGEIAVEHVDYIIPPFADAHIHGGWGLSFQKGEFEELEKKLIQNGVFFAIPTLMNDSLENLEKISNIFEKYKKSNPDSIFPFLRVEGPFISYGKAGAQDLSFSVKPTHENIKDFLSIENIKLFTFAPEIENSEILVNEALKKGKIPSIGHSDGTYADFLKAYNLGVRHFTHFPNALSALHHREFGMIGAGFLYDDLQLEVIGDFVHSSPEFLKLVRKFKKDTISLISDLIPQHATDNKTFDNTKIVKEQRKITNEKGVILGGDTLVSEQIKLLFKSGWTIEELVIMGCVNNRKFFNYKIPSLKTGEKASFIILNDKLEIKEIYYNGEKICSP